jgi:hypothetical protein
VLLDQLADRRLGRRRIERDDHLAAVVDPLLDLDDVVAGDQVGERHLGLHVVVVGAGGAGDPQGVAGPLGDDQPDLAAAWSAAWPGAGRRPRSRRRRR